MKNNHALNEAQIEALLKPFDHGIVVGRESDGQRQLPHHYVRGRLQEIFGPLGWSEQTLELSEIPLGNSDIYKAVAYRAQVRVIVRNPDGTPGAFWDGAGAWGIERKKDNPQPVWEMHSDARNGALSVAFCRATKNLGNAFGLALYDDEDPTAGRVRVRHFLPYVSEDTEEEKEPTQHTLDADEDIREYERPNDPT